jgi:hypothetical protein
MINGVSLPFFRLAAKTGCTRNGTSAALLAREGANRTTCVACARPHEGVRSANMGGVSRATAFRSRFFASGETAPASSPALPFFRLRRKPAARATALNQLLFACGKTVLLSLPALNSIEEFAPRTLVNKSEARP